MHRKTVRATVVLLAAVLLSGGCSGDGGGVTDRLEMTSGDPASPAQVDEESVQEEAIDMGLELADAIEIVQFRSQLAETIADLEPQFGERLIYGTYLEQMPQYVVYVTEIIEGDQDWLQSTSATGLGGTLAIEANPSLERPDGPCLDRTYQVYGDTDVAASAGEQSVRAAPGHTNIGFCPGLGREDSLHGDGFFLMVDEAVLTVAPGETVAVEVTGLRSPSFVATLDIDRDYTDDGGAHVWDLIAPDQPGTYDVDLTIAWAQGDGLYRIQLIVVEP